MPRPAFLGRARASRSGPPPTPRGRPQARGRAQMTRVRALNIVPRAQRCAIVRDPSGHHTCGTPARMRTLVADDDPIITTILSTTLARSGMEVTVAHDGDVAWQALNALE